MLPFDKIILTIFSDHASDPAFVTLSRENAVKAVATAGVAPETPQA